MKPYFYKLKHKTSSKYYVGSQYGKNSNPENLWKDYYTSSKVVCELVKLYGKDSFEIVTIKQRDDAREYEQKYLMRCYKFLGRDKFLNLFLNRTLSPGILLTDEIIAKANIKRKISNSLSAKRLLEKGTHNFQLNKYIPDENHRQKSSERMKGNKLGSLRIITNELKQKLSNKSKGNTNVRNTKWWNDGKNRKRSKCCPGEGWKEGFKINR